MRLWRALVIVGFLAAVLGAAFVVREGNPVADAGQTLGYTPPAGQPKVSVLGDAFTAGTVYGGQSNSWPSLLATAENWAVSNDAQPTMSFVSSASSHTTFASQVDTLAGDDPSIILIFAAHDDIGQVPARVGAAAKALLLTLDSRFPSAKVVLIGPVWPDGSPSHDAVLLRDAEQSAVRQAKTGASFIDPLAQSWFAGRFATLISADNLHPNDDGHAHMAYLLQVDLQRVGLDPAGIRLLDPTPAAIVTSVATQTKLVTATVTAQPSPGPTVSLTQTVTQTQTETQTETQTVTAARS